MWTSTRMPGLQLLSQRALDRRQRHGIALDSLDLPVSPSAIAAVLAVGKTEALPSASFMKAAGSMAS